MKRVHPAQSSLALKAENKFVFYCIACVYLFMPVAASQVHRVKVMVEMNGHSLNLPAGHGHACFIVP